MFSISKVNAQFQTGIFSSNYSGIMGVHVNPAGTSWLSDGADFLPGAGSFEVVNNNYYIDAAPLYKIFSPELFKVISDSSNSNMLSSLTTKYDLKKDLHNTGYAQITGIAYGPSLLINHLKRSYGFITSFKTLSSGVNIPREAADFLFNGAKPSLSLANKPYDATGFGAAAVSFLDLGYTNSNLVFNHGGDQLRVGFNIRALLATNSYFYNDLGSVYNIQSDSNFIFSNGNIRYGFAAHNARKKESFLALRGAGLALDLGFVYIKKDHPTATRVNKKCPNIYGFYRDYQTYKWRLGMSVTDIGSIYFFNQTYDREFDNINYNYHRLDSLVYSGVFTFDGRMRERIGGSDGVVSKMDNSYNLYMPTRFNVQLDIHLKKSWYINILATQRVALAKMAGVKGTNVISSAIRYERQYFEVAVPVSLVEYSYPTAGLYVRLGFLFFGTNTLPEIVGLREIKNTDFYAGIKFNIGFVGGRFGMGF